MCAKNLEICTIFEIVQLPTVPTDYSQTNDLMAINLDLHLDHLKISSDTQIWISSKLDQFEEGHHDISGAHLSVKQMSGKPTVNTYEAKLTLFHKPDHIVGSHKSKSIPSAIQEAFTSAERQLRNSRRAMRDRRRRARTEDLFDE